MKLLQKILVSSTLITGFMLASSKLMALPPPPPPPPGVPIDGGVAFLAAVGLAYGAKKIYDRNKADKK